MLPGKSAQASSGYLSAQVSVDSSHLQNQGQVPSIPVVLPHVVLIQIAILVSYFHLRCACVYGLKIIYYNMFRAPAFWPWPITWCQVRRFAQVAPCRCSKYIRVWSISDLGFLDWGCQPVLLYLFFKGWAVVLFRPWSLSEFICFCRTLFAVLFWPFAHFASP